MIITILILILSVFLGSVIGFFLKKFKINFVHYLLIYSAGFLLSFTFIELFPFLFYSNYIDSIYILIGILIQIVLEFFTKGIEHGHVFHYQKKIPYTVIIGLFLHSFLEGIPISLKEKDLLFAIFIHNIPVSFLLSYFLFKSQLKHIYAYIILFIFSIGGPMGILLGNYISNNLKNKSLAIVSGIFLYISLLIIFENNKKHNFKIINIIWIIFGFISVIILHSLV